MLSSSVIFESFSTPWTIPRQAPLSMGSPRKDYWSGLPFPPPGDLSDPGIEPKSAVAPALAGRLFAAEPPESTWWITSKLYGFKQQSFHLFMILEISSLS